MTCGSAILRLTSVLLRLKEGQMIRSFRLRSFPLFVLALLVFTPSALAQATARVEGIVTDSSNSKLPGVTVTATNTGTNVSRTVVTEGEGAYHVTTLLDCSYRVQC